MKKAILICLLFTISFSFSQETVNKKDVKVGLVLSGGGAKGLAHIAVLKVLEEAGVRVDYIGGTSMGAIIGGLYASGYTANELDSIVKTIDFDLILSNYTPRKAKPFYEKEDGEKYALSLPIKKKTVGIPRAISGGQNVLNLLTKLTDHVNNISDFNELPIPFFCIATNLETGNQELLNNGFLPLAISASGSFPTLLAPVEYEGKLMTDGGVVNNFPVEELKNMGADIVIGVDIQSGLDNREDLDSAVKILNQIVGFQMYKTLEYKYKYVDLLLKPNMKNYNVVSFDDINGIMKQGDSVARANYIGLEKIAQLQDHSKKRIVEKSNFKKFHISRIEVSGTENYTRAYILGKLNLKKRDTTSHRQLVESVNNLTATNNFEKIQYKIEETNDGCVLTFNVKENSIQNYLQFGAHYDGLYKTGVLVNVTSKHLLAKNDILSADLILGDNLRYNINYFIDNGFYWSLGFRFRYNSFSKNVKFIESDVNKINLVYEDFTNQAYVQTVFSRKFAIGAGVEYKRLNAYTETVVEVGTTEAESDGYLYFDKSDYFNALGYLKLDTYDKSYFPKTGWFFNGNLIFYISSSDYNNNFEPFSQLTGDFGVAFTFFDKLTLHFISEAGLTLGDNDNRALDFNVGGNGENFINNFIPFYGYDFAELNADSYLRSGLTFRYELFQKNYLSLSGNYARVEEDIFNEGKIFEDTKRGYKAGYGLETFLGPIEVNYAWSPDHNIDFWYFNVGFWF